ncbi:DDE-type integrase/transposase/recombinase [Desulforegula conservatrix]|uniref:DDE-type integrase/transposase/recombinase n=1 Tax=Desulforegula conservatrix TaxID=153026 RepID=UPI0018DE416C|nr:DDE-type integrase/transposase/recombinase [Desulforegula conservatrix]
MVDRLKSAPYGTKQAVMTDYSKLTGLSIQQLHVIAKKNGYDPGRKKRSDAGKSVVTDDFLRWIAGRMETGKRQKKGVIMPVEQALLDAEMLGIIEPGTISVSRLNALLRERGLNAAALDAPDPHCDMRSLHPNHVHLWDSSVCIQYYLRGGKKLEIMDERQFYKNKPENFLKVKTRLTRYVLVDHYSHAIWVKYYLEAGESAAVVFDFLCSAWAPKKDQRLPFRGVSFVCLADKGSANVSKSVQGFLERLGVTFPDGKPYSARRQGSVERAHQIIETLFESRLAFSPADDLNTLNEWALDFCVWVNSKKRHTRHKMFRTDCWLKIKKEQLRELPDMDIVQMCFREPERDCKVNGNYTIRLKNNWYRIKDIPGIIPGRSHVKAIIKPMEWPDLTISHEGIEYRFSPIKRDDAGFFEDAAVIGESFKAVPESITQKEKKIIENLAFGEDHKKGAVPFAGSGTLGRLAESVDRINMPRTGTPIILDKSNVEDREEPIMQLFVRLKGLGQISKNLNAGLRARYGNTIKSSELERVLEAYEAGLLTPDGEIMGGVDDSAKAANQ